LTETATAFIDLMCKLELIYVALVLKSHGNRVVPYHYYMHICKAHNVSN